MFDPFGIAEWLGLEKVADPFMTALTWFLNILLIGIPYVVGSFGSMLFALSALFTDATYFLNTLVLDFVGTGFRVSLSVANLGFVLALILIAFATILRYEEYGVKKMLGKLILTAVLVNFSLLIAGVFVDFSNVLTGQFINALGAADLDLSDFIAQVLGPQRVLVKPSLRVLGGSLLDLDHLAIILGAIAASSFTWLMVIVMAAIGVMFISRFFHLVVLIILMPLAWMFSVMPHYNSLSKKWWDLFLKQIFVFPAAGFFIFIALRMAGSLNQTINTNTLDTTRVGFGMSGEAVLSYIDIIIGGGLLVGAIIAAHSLGAAGAGTVMKFAQKVKGTALKWGKTAGKGIGKEVARGTLATAGAKKTAGGVSNLLSMRGLRWMPGVKGLANVLAGKAQRKNEVEEYQKTRLSNLGDAPFQSFMDHPPAGAVAQAAVLADAVKRKKMGDLAKNIGVDEADPKKAKQLKLAHLRSYVEAAQSANPGMQIDKIPDVQSVLDANPEMAYDLVGRELMEKDRKDTEQKIATAQKRKEDTSKLEETLNLIKEAQQGNTKAIKDMTEKMAMERVKKMSSTKAAELSKDSLKDKNVALALNQYQISSIMKESQEKTDALKETLEKPLSINRDDEGNTLAELNKLIADWNKEIREAKNIGDESRVKTLQVQVRERTAGRDKLLTKGTDEEQKTKRASYERLELINRKPGSSYEFV